MHIKLTPAEQLVLVELAKGPQDDREIARNLNISPSTVRVHLTRMREKTGTKNRTQLLLWALREAHRMVAPRQPTGWECPRCHTIHAPQVGRCDCPAPTVVSTTIRIG